MQKMVRDQLVIIDEILAKRGSELIMRPLEAAIFFVEECIVEIKGDTKEDFAEKKWFADIYRWTYGWYRERYGDALNDRKREYGKGIVRVYGTPFALNVPLTVTEDEDPGNTVWLIFPDSLMPDEIPTDWLHPKPNLEHLSLEDSKTLEQEIEFVTTSIRSIERSLSTADYPAPSSQMLGGSIAAHVETAVQGILSGKREQVSVGLWELHLAMEKALKLFLSQKSGTPPKTHDLGQLRKLAEPHAESTILDSSFRDCPTATEAISYRYGENKSVSVEAAIQTYYASLRIVRFYASALDKTIIMNNARFLLQKPPWAR